MLRTTLTAATAFLCPIAAISAPAESPMQAAHDVVSRVTPEYAERVQFRLKSSLSTPVIEGEGANICISAPNVKEAIRAYGYYLRKMARVHLSWNGDNKSVAKFVVPKKSVSVPEALPFNYAYNYCTLSYTTMHWDKERWEQELDRLALAGYTHALVTSGLEKVWQNFLTKLNCSREIIEQFIPLPTHAAWWNMANLEGEGGPVSQTLIDSEAKLGRFLVKRMRELGMEPVLQGYVGFIPHNFPREHVSGDILPQGKWIAYERPAVLVPTSPSFGEVAALWYKELHKVYGYTAKFYGGDLFHEGGNKGNANLKACAEAVQSAMANASPGSTWLLQAWGHNPDPNLLSGTDPEHTIVLELDKDNTEHHNMPGGRGGRKHVWCELANFGGKHGMFGGLPLLERLDGNINGSLGVGLLSEGLETNPLYYAMLTERINNREKIDREDFIKEYAHARYGSKDERLVQALSILADTVYKPMQYREGGQENILCARPRLNATRVSTWASPDGYYDTEKLVQVRDLLAKAGKADAKLAARETFRYDFADVSRQVIADAARPQLTRCREAFERKDARAFREESEKFLDLIRESASVLATSEHFLLGRFLLGVAKRGSNKADSKELVRSMKQLITTWRQDIGPLDDYSHRQFSEMMTHYYLPRWKAYFAERQAELAGTGKAAKTVHNAGVDNNGIMTQSSREASAELDRLAREFPTKKIPLLTKPAKASKASKSSKSAKAH